MLKLFIKKVFVIVIFTPMILSCSLTDSTKEFSNGIVHIIEGGKLNTVVKRGEKGFFLVPNIECVEENKQYILFIQSINTDFVKKNMREDISYSNHNDENSIEVNPIFLDNTNKLEKQLNCKKCFWILIKDNDSLIGPFSNLDYVKSYGFDKSPPLARDTALSADKAGSRQ
jgi:hypothetical protein